MPLRVGIPSQPYSFLIEKLDGLIVAQDNKGRVRFSGTDASKVIQEAANSLGTTDYSLLLRPAIYDLYSGLTINVNKTAIQKIYIKSLGVFRARADNITLITVDGNYGAGVVRLEGLHLSNPFNHTGIIGIKNIEQMELEIISPRFFGPMDAAIQLRNKTYWTEGTVIRDARFQNVTKGVELYKEGGYDSFAHTVLDNCRFGETKYPLYINTPCTLPRGKIDIRPHWIRENQRTIYVDGLLEDSDLFIHTEGMGTITDAYVFEITSNGSVKRCKGTWENRGIAITGEVKRAAGRPFEFAIPHHNRAKGIAPTTTGFDTAPTNLGNVVDEDWASVTGTGTTTLTAAGVLGRVVFDLGDVYNVMIIGKFGLWSSANRIDLYVHYSDDGVTYIPIGERLGNVISTTESVEYIMIPFIRARYFRIQFNGSGAMDGNVKIYEIMALDLGW